MTGDIGLDALRRMADMHAVYRMFDANGKVLYIGISGVVGRRFDQHSQKVWFPQVSTITLEWFPTKAAAVLAERHAILAERPRYNVDGTRRRKTPEPKAPSLHPAEPRRGAEYPSDILARIAAIRADLASGVARERRLRAGIRNVEFAAVLGVTRSAVSQWEHGNRVPSADSALAYGEALESLGIRATETEVPESDVA